ncbi:MAG: amidohydrolase family protein, partial [Spirochaetales bacterium]
KNDKELGKNDFSKIPNGLPGVQHRAQLIFTGGNVGKDSESIAKNEPHLDVTQFSALMSENAAKIFGLYPERGVIAPGAIADITVWDPLHTETITVETCLQNVDYTPYEGFDVQGRAKYVILNGKVCATEGRIIQEGKGTYLFRKTGFSEE